MFTALGAVSSEPLASLDLRGLCRAPRRVWWSQAGSQQHPQPRGQGVVWCGARAPGSAQSPHRVLCHGMETTWGHPEPCGCISTRLQGGMLSWHWWSLVPGACLCGQDSQMCKVLNICQQPVPACPYPGCCFCRIWSPRLPKLLCSLQVCFASLSLAKVIQNPAPWLSLSWGYQEGDGSCMSPCSRLRMKHSLKANPELGAAYI